MQLLQLLPVKIANAILLQHKRGFIIASYQNNDDRDENKRATDKILTSRIYNP